MMCSDVVLDSNLGRFDDSLPVGAGIGNLDESGFPLALVAFWRIAQLSRDDRLRLENELLQLPQVELPTEHKFSVGVYARTIFMPAGTIVIGKLHATEHLNIVSRGKCSVWTEQAGFDVYEGHCIFNSVAGTKKYLYIHEDTVWTTIHVTECRDLVELERELIISDATVLGAAI